MLSFDVEKYYKEHSSELGWGAEVATLNPERLE